ncbi:MAG: rhomboid family intramembrane serine protease [Chloroflexi bacterium HGW-Chloroflexi-8]|nr:MAG: rhomboid family intramembrane serine protease [Chloroflexi bacterium HGW-Chloroflexi-8]
MSNYSQNPNPDDPSQQPKPQRVRINLPAKKPYVMYTILGLTILVYLVQMATNYFLGVDLASAYLAKVNSMILNGQFWRLISPILVHGSITHIGFNMYALYIFGQNLEYQYGHGRFLLLYLLSGFAGNVVSFVMSTSPSVGASTAIFGMVAAQGVFIFRNRKFFGDRARGILMNIAFILGINLVLGLSPMIDNWGHLGGLLGGLVFSWTAGPLWKMQVDVNGYHLEDQQEKHNIVFGALVVFIAFAALSMVRWF